MKRGLKTNSYFVNLFNITSAIKLSNLPSNEVLLVFYVATTFVVEVRCSSEVFVIITI